MEAMCANHPARSAQSLCHSCGRQFCGECLTEGLVYYYCASAECQARLHEESLPEVVTCPSCKEDLELTTRERVEKKFLCPLCHRFVDFSEAMPPDAAGSKQGSTSEELRPKAIGGWLILAAIGLVTYPLRALAAVLTNIMPTFQHDTWSVLTTPGTDAYHPMWAPLLLFELGGSLILMAFSIVVAVAFFQKKAIAPRFIIVFLLSQFLFALTENLLAGEIPLLAQEGHARASQQVFASFFVFAIWSTYFLVSKRVKSTFLL